MPNIFRSKHKDRVSPQRSSISGTVTSTARVPGKETGLPSPPRSPEGSMQPLAGVPGGGGGYHDGGDYQASGGYHHQKPGPAPQQGNYGSYGAASQFRNDGSTSTVSSSSLASDSRARDSSAATSMNSGKDMLNEVDMHDAYLDGNAGYGSGGAGQHHGGGAGGYGDGYHHTSSHQQAGYQSSSQYSAQQAQMQHQQQSSRPLQPPQGQQHLQPSQQTQPSSQQHLLATPATIQASPSPSQGSSLTRKTTSRYALNDFALIRTLGTGSFGRVHLARSRHNGRGYAIKVLAKDRVVRMKQVEHTNSEREMLDRVRHPFLVNLWGTFADARNLYMVMDFVAGGELFSLLRKSQRFPDPVAKFFGAEVALALDYLHSMDIIYRDLKPENILLGADGHIKITDFGFAKHVPDITWTLCGTPDYLAPEIVQSKGYNKSVDWYALGVLVFEMLAGYPPFFTEDPNPMRLYEKIIAGKIRYPSYFSPEAKDLLKALLTADLTKRFGNLASGSGDIFRHAWFAEVDWERLYRKEIPAPYVPRVESEWDASNFDQYPEVDIAEYGQPGSDQHSGLFPYW